MRLSIQIVLFLLFFEAGAGLLVDAGIAGDLGIEPEPGNPDELQEANQTAGDFDSGSGGGSTLFDMYQNLANVVSVIINGVFPGRSMLINVGVPAAFVDFLYAAATVYVGLDAIGFLRSGGLTE